MYAHTLCIDMCIYIHLICVYSDEPLTLHPAPKPLRSIRSLIERHAYDSRSLLHDAVLMRCRRAGCAPEHV